MKKKDKNLIPYSELKNGKCRDGGRHKVWLSYVGDNWPAFCANKNCGKHSVDVPVSDRDFD